MILPLAQKLNLCLKTSTIPCNDLFPQVLEYNNLRYYIIFEFKNLKYYTRGLVPFKELMAFSICRPPGLPNIFRQKRKRLI